MNSRTTHEKRNSVYTVAAALAGEDICVRSGLHCAPLAHGSAGTLDTGTVRFSFSPFNTHGEIEKAAAKLIKII